MQTQKERLVVKDLYKVFGDHPQQAMELVRAGQDKAEIFAQTGQTIGVNGASFSVREGEIFVVMGLSGSGKSTLVRLLNRLIDPTAGQVLFDGVDIAAMNDKQLRAFRRKHISMVFQSFALMPHLTVLQNVGFGLELDGIGKRTRNERAMKALAQVGLAERADSYPDELSGGMQQRVGLARALANDPSILLMDEAFSALDPLIRTGMQDELVKLQQTDRRTIIFISHDLDEALRIGDRIAIMEGGNVVQVGTAEDIIKNPANDYVRAFFKNVDVTHVFTAGELADKEGPLVLVQEQVSAPDALEQLEGTDVDYAFLVDAQQHFIGMVSQSRLQAALRRDAQAELTRALMRGIDPIGANTPVSQVYGLVSAKPHGLPVTDDAGHFLGALTPRIVIDFLAARADA